MLLAAALLGCAAERGRVAATGDGAEAASPPTPAAYEVLVVEQAAGRLGVFSSRGERIAGIALGLKPHEIEVDAEARFAYVSNFGVEDYDRSIGVPGDSVAVIDIAARRAVADLSTRDPGSDGPRGPHGLLLQPPARRLLFVNVEFGDRMLVFDTNSHVRVRDFPLPPHVHHFVFAADGATLFAFAGADGVYRIAAHDGRVEAHWRSPTPVRGLAWSADGSLLASGRGEVTWLDPATLAVIRRVEVPGAGQIVYSLPLPDGRVFAPSVYEHTVFVLGDGVPRALNAGRTPIALAPTPDGRVAFVSNPTDTHVHRIDLDTLAVSRFAAAGGPNRIAVVPRRAP